MRISKTVFRDVLLFFVALIALICTRYWYVLSSVFGLKHDAPVCEIVPGNVDLGEVNRGENTQGKFRIVNHTKNAVKIHGEVVSCSCISLSPHTDQILPGESLEIIADIEIPDNASGGVFRPNVKYLLEESGNLVSRSIEFSVSIPIDSVEDDIFSKPSLEGNENDTSDNGDLSEGVIGFPCEHRTTIEVGGSRRYCFSNDNNIRRDRLYIPDIILADFGVLIATCSNTKNIIRRYPT